MPIHQAGMPQPFEVDGREFTWTDIGGGGLEIDRLMVGSGSRGVASTLWLTVMISGNRRVPSRSESNCFR